MVMAAKPDVIKVGIEINKLKLKTMLFAVRNRQNNVKYFA